MHGEMKRVYFVFYIVSLFNDFKGLFQNSRSKFQAFFFDFPDKSGWVDDLLHMKHAGRKG